MKTIFCKGGPLNGETKRILDDCREIRYVAKPVPPPFGGLFAEDGARAVPTISIYRPSGGKISGGGDDGKEIWVMK